MDSKNVPNLNNVVKKTKGRQKIEMKKMSNEQNLQVTFSKRRTGIFKKASELATLCGVDLAVIVFSPSHRVFSFGTPSVDSIIQRYMGRVPPPLLNLDLNEAHITMDESELHAHLAYLSNQLAFEKKRAEDLDHLLKAIEHQFWWAKPIESMNKAQLEKYKTVLEELKTHVNEKKEKLLFKSAFTYNSPQLFVGGSSSSSVNNTVTVCSPPLMQNRVGVIDGSILRHRQFNMHEHGHRDGPTFRFF
ncbi:Agamous MADS-box protein AGL62 [Spatholobus suberectus]|nr:Agamous MADS-box protein AGL62 [Spatholobus suberectus]